MPEALTTGVMAAARDCPTNGTSVRMATPEQLRRLEEAEHKLRLKTAKADYRYALTLACLPRQPLEGRCCHIDEETFRKHVIAGDVPGYTAEQLAEYDALHGPPEQLAEFDAMRAKAEQKEPQLTRDPHTKRKPGRPPMRPATSAKAPKTTSKRKRCPHNRLKAVCKECGGSSICEHQRVRSRCKECGGTGICEHQRIRSQCKECGGGAICEHQRVRTRCKDCRRARELKASATGAHGCKRSKI